MFLKNFFKDNKSIIYTVSIIFIILESLVIISINYKESKDTQNFLLVASPDFKSHTNISSFHLTDQANLFFAIKINKPDIIKIMSEASNTKDTKRLSELRENLYKLLSPTYTYMKTKNVRQLHFHLPKSVSFLRFHEPNKYGDSLKGIRKTIDYVNENKVQISAFEEGRIFNGFRNVYPLFDKNKFIGTVEISYSFTAMAQELLKMHSSSYLFMLKKEVVKKKVFNDEQKNYKECEFDDFVYDKKTLLDIMELRLSELFKLNKAISKRVKSLLKEEKLFSIYNKNPNIYENSTIVISFVPIKNLDDKTVAYVIHYEFGNFIDVILKNSRILFLILSILVLVLSSGFTIVLLNEKKKQNIIYKFATHDALTEIFNRHGVNDMLKQKIDESHRHEKALSLIFFDIDFFKDVNDNYGHDIGDYVLQNIAKLVSAEIRASDIFARWGGEEFIIFLPETKINDATDLAQKLRKIIEEHAFSDIDSVTCSFGVTQLKVNDDKTSFLKRVDKLLYKAKESGRNCVINDIDS